ncbi:kinase-like protein [Paxillus ammoniavirescens]|nr:kinase-like protein [Paxillus ammoniavirescens]
MSFRWKAQIWKCILRRDSQSYDVVVKYTVPSSLSAEDLCTKNEQLRRELNLRAGLKHENILPLLGITTGFGPLTALVYPWMENDILTSYLQRNKGGLSLCDRLELLRDVATGLRYLHSCSIVHGKLRGSNIFVSASGRAQLSGFGFSEIFPEPWDNGVSSSTESVRWLAPESLTTGHDGLSSSGAPLKKSDVYSFGSVMLQVCSGEVPYANIRRDTDVVLALYDGVTPSRPTTQWMNDRMWVFIQRCWSIEEKGAKRPSAEEALNFIQEEISLLCPIICSDPASDLLLLSSE